MNEAEIIKTFNDLYEKIILLQKEVLKLKEQREVDNFLR